ncbi:MAG TPA: HYExAFE family protein [Pirellulaceae bacterium]|nr:HYExAFE family protein [Pirellulaceae bacterium]
MAKRNNHYEAAFEAWLRRLRVPYVAVDETHRSLAGAGSLKSVDFIVSPPGQATTVADSAAPAHWLVDVKGRRFPTGASYWKNWSTADELASLASWETLFGARFAALLVFAYNVIGSRAPLPADELFVFRGSLYGFVAIRLDHYTSCAQPLSPRWGTVCMPVAHFRALARPAREVLGAPRRVGMGAA